MRGEAEYGLQECAPSRRLSSALYPFSVIRDAQAGRRGGLKIALRVYLVSLYITVSI